jgi:hypothetical protein
MGVKRFSGLGLLDDLAGRGFGALNVGLQAFGLRDPAIDVGCGLG